MDLTKKGTLFTIPHGKTVKYWCTGWSIDDEDNTSDIISGEYESLGIFTRNGEDYVRFDRKDYKGTDYLSAPLKHLELLLNIKQTNMTTKAIAIATARKWPTENLVDGQRFSTKQGEIYIHKKANGAVYILSNLYSLNGTKPRPIPRVGFSYSYYVTAAGDIETDLTCGGKLTAFKQQVEEEKKTMKFTQNFKVRGAAALLRAFKEEVEEIGWKFTGAEITKASTGLVFEGGTFHVGNEWVEDNVWNLPGEWDDAIEGAKDQTEVDDVEYVECITDGLYADGLSKGRIYKRDLDYDGWEDKYSVEDDQGDSVEWNKDNFKPSTKEAFEAQGANIFTVGGYKINIKEVKINGYKTMKMACIGCTTSQQVYSLGALEALYDIMYDNTATFEDKNVTFTKEQVKALIVALA